MTQLRPTYDDLEHQELVARAHALIAAIASKPSGTKLLRGVLPVLEQYAGYKKGRWRRLRGQG